VGSALTAYVREIVRATGDTKTRVDWDKASNIARAGRGYTCFKSFSSGVTPVAFIDRH
jgi:hypothetical protein